MKYAILCCFQIFYQCPSPRSTYISRQVDKCEIKKTKITIIFMIRIELINRTSDQPLLYYFIIMYRFCSFFSALMLTAYTTLGNAGELSVSQFTSEFHDKCFKRSQTLLVRFFWMLSTIHDAESFWVTAFNRTMKQPWSPTYLPLHPPQSHINTTL